jgi:hypothetical protein
MTRSEQILIKKEFDRIVRYFDKRGDKLTVNECKQEIGALRMFIYNLKTDNHNKE